MAVTVTYTHPVAGITAPTALQSSNAQSVIADVIATADGDTTAVVTHNFGLTAAELASGFPNVIMTPVLSQALAALSSWTNTANAANTSTFTKLATAGSGNAANQLHVTVQRPHSIIR
jgi:hypothetical protein